MVLLKDCENLIEAQHLSNRLENAGIVSCILDQYSDLLGQINMSASGVRVMVRKEDLESATSIMNETPNQE